MRKDIRWINILLLTALLLTSCQPGAQQSLATPTAETLSVDVAPPTSPQIIHQLPLPGEKLGQNVPISITFDRPMEQKNFSTGWFFRDESGNPVRGNFTWLDDATVQFKPARPLTAGAEYLLTLSDISSTDGVPLSEEINLRYQVVDALEVSQVFPADLSDYVDKGTAITVIFNKPVIPLMTAEEQAKLSLPIRIQPPVKGSGRWVSTSVYVFEPEGGLNSGTKYQVTVGRNIKDTTGMTLGKDFTWSFITNAPEVVDLTIKGVGRYYTDTIEGLELERLITVTFTQPMDQQSVEAAFQLFNVENGSSFPVTLSWNDKSTELTISPNKKYEIASFYNLFIDPTARAQDGGNLRKALDIKLATVPLPGIRSAIPNSGKQSIFSSVASVDFLSPMEFSTLESRVRITPAPAKPVRLVYNDGAQRLDIIGLEPATEYVIRILPGATDIYGNPIQREYAFSFETARLTSTAQLVAPYYPLIFRPESEIGMYFEYTNLESANFSLYRMDYERFASILNGSTPYDNPPTKQMEMVESWSLALDPNQNRFMRVFLRPPAELPALTPGYYFLGLDAPPIVHTNTSFQQGVVFIVADANLTLKASQQEALAWLVDSASGKPLSGVPLIFYDSYMNAIGRASTDKDGLAYVKNLKDPQYVRTDDPAHTAMTALYWGSGVNEGQFGIWTDYWNQTQPLFSHVYTERPLYRPDQPVYIKGILRNSDDLHYSLPNLKQVYLSIENDQGSVYKGYVDVSANGTFASEYTLGADAPVGNYFINLREHPSSENYLGGTYFRVAEYVKPEFAVSASAVPDTVLTGEPVTFGLDAAYYSGGNLSNADVSWFLEARPYYYTPPAEYNNYSFNDYDYYRYYYDGSSGTSGSPIIKDGAGLTDENGHFEMVETIEIPQDGENKQVAFSANVSDVGGNLVGASAQVVVLGSAIHAGIRPEEYIGQVGKVQSFSAVVLDRDGKPLAGRPIRVEFAEQRWFSVIREDEDGVSRWETSVQVIPAGSITAATDENGLATVQFTPPNGGEFKATITAADDEGRITKASTYLWVWSESYIPWRQTNDRSFTLVADKDSYNPGDTAKILIAQPFEGETTALITVERGHIYEKKVVKLTNTSVFELPITSDMAPIMYVSVMVVKGADGDTPPDFKMGMVRVNVNPSQQKIFVSVESDKESARPGEAVTYTVTTRGLDGKPVQADVSLALVDKAVLALAPEISLPLLEAFYPERGLAIMTASSIVLNAEDFNANYQETEPTGQSAGSGGGKGEGENGIVTVRQNFKDTAFWKAQVLTDKNGKASVTVTLPDNLTTWEMKARAITADTRMGEATSELLSTRPLQVQLQTPRFFVIDDVLTLGAVIHNNTEKALSVKVKLEAEGVNIQSDAEQTIRVEAAQQAYVTWDVAVERGAPRVDLTASVESGSYSDSTKPTLGTLPGNGIPVLSYHVTETVGASGFLREAGSTTEAVRLPKGMEVLGGALKLDVSPTLAASMIDGLDYLNDYPYLCMEQTVSRFLPNLVSLQALQLAGKDTSELKQSLEEQIRPALQRISNNQNYDGGWGLWPGSDSQSTTTAYVILGLVEAKKAGYTIPESVLDNGLYYLDSNLPGVSAGTSRWQKNQAAFMLYALARGGRINDGRIASVYTYRNKMDLYGKALLMQTLYMGDPKDERVNTLLGELNNAAAQSAAGAWWNEEETDYWNWNTDTRSTAIILNALIQVDPQSKLIPGGIRWLMKHRNGSHWYSTQETSWALMALTNWLVESNELNANYDFAIGLNGNLIKKHHVGADNLTETTTLWLDVEKLLADTTNYIVLTHGSGPGVLYYSAYMDYMLPVKKVPALDQGILVSRQYFQVNDLKSPISEVERGELVQVKVTLVVPHDLHYVVVDDPLPAGLEAIDASLLTSQQVPAIYQPNDYDRYGWGWWYFYYKQIYDEKVVMSADYLPAGTYTITYLARASIKGTFNVLPATAKEFYFPDVSGRSAGSVFTVK